MSTFQQIVALFGRVCLGSIFVWSGAQDILGWDDFLQDIAGKLPVLHQPWVVDNGPAVSLVLGITTVVLLLAGGLLMALGLRARLGAVLLMVFLVPVTVLFHDFWSLDPTDSLYREQAVAFLKNIGLFGGLLMVLAFGGGAIGADGLFRHKEE